jgi:hypothetical protein
VNPRLLVGNLDCESEYARAPRGLPAPIAELASALATLLRALGRDGDRLWTPRPVDAARVVDHPQLPKVLLESGPLRDASPAAQVLAWGETASTAALRGPVAPPSPPAAAPLAQALWRLPHPTPEAAARGNHRGFAFELAHALGCALPGARRVRSQDELKAHLARGGADAGRGAWVVKAPYGAAGRERLKRRGQELSPDVRVRIDRLLAAHGELLFEPWVERRDDYGVCGLVTGGAPILYPPHRLRCDRQGVIRSIELDDEGAAPDALRGELEAVARAVAEALDRAGYRGPFNVDAFRWIDAHGELRVQPLCEINARLSLGFLTRALGERFASPGRAELRLAAADEPGALELLRPGGRDGAAAALIIPPRSRP